MQEHQPILWPPFPAQTDYRVQGGHLRGGAFEVENDMANRLFGGTGADEGPRQQGQAVKNLVLESITL